MLTDIIGNGIRGQTRAQLHNLKGFFARDTYSTAIIRISISHESVTEKS